MSSGIMWKRYMSMALPFLLYIFAIGIPMLELFLFAEFTITGVFNPERVITQAGLWIGALLWCMGIMSMFIICKVKRRFDILDVGGVLSSAFMVYLCIGSMYDEKLKSIGWSLVWVNAAISVEHYRFWYELHKKKRE